MYVFAVVTTMSFCDVDVINDCRLCMYIHTCVFIKRYNVRRTSSLFFTPVLTAKNRTHQVIPVYHFESDQSHEALPIAECLSKLMLIRSPSSHASDIVISYQLFPRIHSTVTLGIPTNFQSFVHSKAIHYSGHSRTGIETVMA